MGAQSGGGDLCSTKDLRSAGYRMQCGRDAGELQQSAASSFTNKRIKACGGVGQSVSSRARAEERPRPRLDVVE